MRRFWSEVALRGVMQKNVRWFCVCPVCVGCALIKFFPLRLSIVITMSRKGLIIPSLCFWLSYSAGR